MIETAVTGQTNNFKALLAEVRVRFHQAGCGGLAELEWIGGKRRKSTMATASPSAVTSSGTA